MRQTVFVLVASMVIGLPLTQRAPAAEPMDKAAFAEFLAKMQTAAETAKLTEPNDPLFWTLRDQSYKDDALEPLRAALTTLPATDTGMFVAGRLLIPLAMSDPEVVRKAIPAVTSAQARLVKYQGLPVFTKDQLKSMVLPPTPDPKATAEQALKVLSDYAEQRQKRLEIEGRAGRMNMQAMHLERAISEVLLRAGRPAEDDRVMDMISKAEQDKRIVYMYLLDAIEAQAPKMDQTRATRLYKALEKAGTALMMVEANYYNPAHVVFNTADNSAFRGRYCFPGVDMLTAANALAPVAKLPVLKSPTATEVAAANALNEAKGLPAAKKTPALQKLIKDFPGTPAAEEAKNMLKPAPAKGGG